MEDKITSFLAYNGRVGVTCIKSTKMVEEARKIHDLSPLATAALGRVLTITALMANEMKGKEDKITVQIKGNGENDGLVKTSAKKIEITSEHPVVANVDGEILKADQFNINAEAGKIKVVQNRRVLKLIRKK